MRLVELVEEPSGFGEQPCAEFGPLRSQVDFACADLRG